MGNVRLNGMSGRGVWLRTVYLILRILNHQPGSFVMKRRDFIKKAGTVAAVGGVAEL